MKALALVALLAQVHPAAAPWRVEVTTHGGLTGRGAGALKLRSTGELEVVLPGGRRCRLRAPAAALDRVGQAVHRARPSHWRPRYFVPDNPTGCCDQVATTMALVRGPGGAEQRSVTGWFDESRQLVPPDALAVHDAAMELVQASAGCAEVR